GDHNGDNTGRLDSRTLQKPIPSGGERPGPVFFARNRLELSPKERPVRKLLAVVAAAALAGGAWQASKHFELVGLDQLRLAPRGAARAPVASCSRRRRTRWRSMAGVEAFRTRGIGPVASGSPRSKLVHQRR